MVEIWHRLDGGGRQAARPSRMRRFGAVVGASAYSVELKPLLACRAILAEWRELAARAVEPNVFAGPEMMLAAALHLPAAHPPAALVLRERREPGRRLVGIVPLASGRMPVLPDAVRAYVTPYHPVGVPLIDRRHAVGALVAILDWFAGHAHNVPGLGPGAGGVAGMLWPHVPQRGPFALALQEAARLSDRAVTLFAERERHVLRPAARPEELLPHALPSKRRKEIERLSRRMAEIGPLRFEEAIGGRPLRDAVERFMVLEASSWKGERGTALVQNARTSGFIRAATRMLGPTGQCSVLTLFCDETPAAAALVLEMQGRAWYFKVAYDPAFARMSPGLILSAELSRRQQGRPGIEETDSCADGPSRLLGELWRENIPYADMLVAVVPGDTTGARAMCLRERTRRRLRQTAKTLYRRMKGYTR